MLQNQDDSSTDVVDNDVSQQDDSIASTDIVYNSVSEQSSELPLAGVCWTECIFVVSYIQKNVYKMTLSDACLGGSVGWDTVRTHWDGLPE